MHARATEKRRRREEGQDGCRRPRQRQRPLGLQPHGEDVGEGARGRRSCVVWRKIFFMSPRTEGDEGATPSPSRPPEQAPSQ